MKLRRSLFLLLIGGSSLVASLSTASCRTRWKEPLVYRKSMLGWITIPTSLGSVVFTTLGVWPMGIEIALGGGALYAFIKITDRMGRINTLLDEAEVCSGRHITRFYHRYKKNVAMPMSRHELCSTLVAWDTEEKLCSYHAPPSKHKLLKVLEDQAEIPETADVNIP